MGFGGVSFTDYKVVRSHVREPLNLCVRQTARKAFRLSVPRAVRK